MSLPLGVALPSLARWGLSANADLVFRTLATFGPRSAHALAGELGLPRQRIDLGLDELREHGAAVPLPDAPDRRTPVWTNRPPDQVVTVLRRHQVRLANRHAQARRHREVLGSLGVRLAGVGISWDPAVGGSVGDGVRLLRTRAMARRRIAELMPAERHEHLAINTELVFDASSRAAGLPASRSIAARGVRCRTLGRPPLDGDRLAPDRDADLVDGEAFQLRELRDTPLKLFVFDRRTAMFPVDALDFERGYFEVTAPVIVARLVELFEANWAGAVDPQLHAVPMISLSERERDLVTLLALGHTDTSAGRTLRISARSVTYTLRALMDRLGVENRFQLGLALGAMRVVVPPSLTPG